MILQSVPAESSDEEEEVREDVSLYGRSTSGEVSPSPKGKAKKVSRKVREVHAQVQAQGWTRWAWLCACCCLGALAVGALLALLRRFGAEAKDPVDDGPVVVFFSYAPSTDAALAWLAAAVLAGNAPNASSAETLFAAEGGSDGRLLPDGKLVGLWRPPPSGLRRALAHGRVASMLRRVHSLGPPRVQDLSQLDTDRAAASSAPVVPEPDAFLALRSLFADAAEEEERAKDEAKGGKRRLGEKHRTELVLVSHPHHVPYLAVLAQASGFRPLALDPRLYSEVPWADFGCGPLGYAMAGASPQETLSREVGRLAGFEQSLDSEEEERATALRSLLKAANATLAFHLCIAAQAAEAASGNRSHVLTVCSGER